MVAGLDKEYSKLSPLATVRRLASYTFFQGRPIATRGRWINPLVIAHLRMQRRLPQLREVEKPIFIVGTGRSGTTILGTVMSIHRDVGYLMEPKALWHVICPEEDVSGNYSCGTARYRLGEQEASSDVRRAAHRLFGNYLALTLSKQVVDKDPELIFRVPFVRAIFPDAKFVFLVRNGWNTCYSIVRFSQKSGRRVNGESHDWWGVNNRKWKLMLEQLVAPDPVFDDITKDLLDLDSHFNRAVVEWIVTMREGLRRMVQSPECIHLLSFEELVTDPRQVLADLLAFCELPPDDRLFAYAERVLLLPPDHPRPDVEPALLPLFENTLHQLGY
ncbi:MAG: sulfotransferase family protein [Planctomycetota bacterium]|jgi:hypothetical protein